MAHVQPAITVLLAQHQQRKMFVEETNTTAQQLLEAKQVSHQATIQLAEQKQQEQDNHNVQQVHTVQEVFNLIALQEHMEVQQA